MKSNNSGCTTKGATSSGVQRNKSGSSETSKPPILGWTIANEKGDIEPVWGLGCDECVFDIYPTRKLARRHKGAFGKIVRVEIKLLEGSDGL